MGKRRSEPRSGRQCGFGRRGVRLSWGLGACPTDGGRSSSRGWMQFTAAVLSRGTWDAREGGGGRGHPQEGIRAGASSFRATQEWNGSHGKAGMVTPLQTGGHSRTGVDSRRETGRQSCYRNPGGGDGGNGGARTAFSQDRRTHRLLPDQDREEKVGSRVCPSDLGSRRDQGVSA